MAYAMLAGLPPVYGLYGGLIPLLLFALLGTSRHLSIGPVAISSLLILAGVSQIAEPFSEKYIQLVLLTGLLVGIFQALMGVLKMGFLVNFLSHPVVAGFTSAAAIIITINQLKDFLGIPLPQTDYLYEKVLYFIKNIHKTHLLTLAIGSGSIFLLIFLKRINPRIPGALIVVLLGTLLAWGFSWDQRGLDIIKGVEGGWPDFILPDFTMENFRLLLPTVLTVSIIGVVESIGIAKVLEARHQNYTVNPNRELIAIGISKIGGAFFQALPTSGSFSRSAINSEMGARSKLASIVTAFIVALALLFLTPLIFYLPRAVLSAIIIVSVLGLFDWEEGSLLWRRHRRDFWMMLLTFVITLFIGIEEGVLAGVILSVLMVLYRSADPHFVILGNLPDSPYYKNVNRYKKAITEKEILIIRFDAQLYFGNVATFKESIKKAVQDKGNDLKLLIIDASSMNDMDSSGLHALSEIFDYLNNKNIKLYLCDVIGPVRDILKKAYLMEKLGKECFFEYVHNAVEHYHQTKDGASGVWRKSAVQSNVEKSDPNNKP